MYSNTSNIIPLNYTTDEGTERLCAGTVQYCCKIPAGLARQTDTRLKLL